MINVKKLNLSFGSKAVLNNISIAFEPKKIHGIVGLNGAGKTTFFNALTKTIKPDSGEILYLQRPLSKTDVAYLETDNYFYSGITGKEYLKIFKQTNAAFNLDEFQKIFKLPLDDLIENYSTGMKKKLALLGVLKKDKSIYLLDEPFNGLDLETNKVLELIVLALKAKSKTVFVSSHIIDPLLTVCDEIHFMESGTIKKTYQQHQFHQIEEELFGQLKAQVKNLLAGSF